jgi:16S rRNA (guanine966-N2)-methyltransferase
MRVIAGRLGGRNFQSPAGHRTHPMSDKVRGALFNALGDINDLNMLDAFAGSGALAFEAVSRGAKQVVAIDADRSAQRAIQENIRSLNLSRQVTVISATAQAWLSTTDQTFDIVLCDPPYDGVQPELLQRLADRAKPGGLVVLSLPPTINITLDNNYQLLTRKDYGDATLQFYRRLKD